MTAWLSVCASILPNSGQMRDSDAAILPGYAKPTAGIVVLEMAFF
jgi:hypothetical protein